MTAQKSGENMNELVFNPDMLLLARDYRSITQGALAKDLGIGQGTLSKIENGMHFPDEELVKKISNVVKFPVNFFFTQGRAYGQPLSIHPLWRKSASVSVKSLNKMTAELSMRISHLKALFRSVELESSLHWPDFNIDEYDDPEQIANYVRKTWSVRRGPIQNLTDLIEKSGAVIFYCDFSYAKVDGVSLKVAGMPPCIFINNNIPADRMRFTLAHELGHLVMHKQPNPDMEHQANKFASSLLMPKDDFIEDLNRRIDLAELARKKSIWKVSMQAILYRAKDLSLLNENQANYLWRQISAKGYRTREPASTEFSKEIPKIVPEMLNIHMSEFEYSINQMANLFSLNETDFNLLYPSLLDQKPRLRLIK